MAALKALETLSLEGGRVSAGQVFELKSKEEAAVLVAQGRAEETKEATPATSGPAPADFIASAAAEAKETTKKLGHK